MDYINMVAPYQGVLEWVGGPKEGTSQSGNEWKNVNFTLKYLDSQMREQFITFTLTGAGKVDKLLSLPMGTEIKVSWRPISNKYTDKNGVEQWFPQLSAFNVVPIRKEPEDLPAATDQAQRPQAPHTPDDIPY